LQFRLSVLLLHLSLLLHHRHLVWLQRMFRDACLPRPAALQQTFLASRLPRPAVLQPSFQVWKCQLRRAWQQIRPRRCERSQLGERHSPPDD
jgi:hypothetical protein